MLIEDVLHEHTLLLGVTQQTFYSLSTFVWWHNSVFIINSDNRSMNIRHVLLCLQVNAV